MIGADYDDDDDVRGGESVAVRLAYAAGVVFVKFTLAVAVFVACGWFWIWLGNAIYRAIRAAFQGVYQ